MYLGMYNGNRKIQKIDYYMVGLEPRPWSNSNDLYTSEV